VKTQGHLAEKQPVTVSDLYR